MTHLFHIVSFPDDHQEIVQAHEIDKDGMISRRVYVDSDDDDDSYYIEHIKVDIDRSYLVNVTAAFVMNPKDRYKSPLYMSQGGFGINHLAFTYSVTIMEYYGSSSLYQTLHTESGLKTTRFDMYSYHINQEDGTCVYPTDRLEWEVLDAIDLTKLLLGPQ